MLCFRTSLWEALAGIAFTLVWEQGPMTMMGLFPQRASTRSRAMPWLNSFQLGQVWFDSLRLGSAHNYDSWGGHSIRYASMWGPAGSLHDARSPAIARQT